MQMFALIVAMLFPLDYDEPPSRMSVKKVEEEDPPPVITSVQLVVVE
jgi:hypothetical protein